MHGILLAVFLLASVAAADAAEIRVATFNTESDDDTQPVKVAETIRGVYGVDIWALQEVESEDALKIYRDAAQSSSDTHWRFIISESGVYGDPDRKSDQLGILYRSDRFRLLASFEYHAIRSMPDGTKYGKPDWGMRAALFLRLAEIGTDREFYVGTVHLKCCAEGDAQRAHQAHLIAEWIKKSDVPVILLGDTNIPIEPGRTTDQVTFPAFRKLIDEAGLIWVEPSNPIKTRCDPVLNLMLDQVYHTPNLAATQAVTEIQFPEEQYCELDPQGYSDHRPVVARFTFP